MPIFGAYDIRGRYPAELNEKTAYIIGRAVVVFLHAKKIIVGRDVRLSSDRLFQALANGIRDQGADVIDIGLCTTPMLYFSSSLGCDGAVMVTASHLGKECNGFKICLKNGLSILYNTGLNKIEQLVKKNKFSARRKGKITQKNISKRYKVFILKGRKRIHIKAVVDAGNMMGALDGKILKEICKVFPLFFKLDGTFPNRNVNPLLDPLSQLSKRVQQQKADLGIAFDGDADRVVFVDEQGRKISPDIIFALFCYHYLQQKQTALTDARSTRTILETVQMKKGKCVLIEAGHSIITLAMHKHHARFAGEKSGHYYFQEFFSTDNALLAAIYLINVLEQEQQPLSRLVQPFQKYASSEELNFPASNPEKTMKIIEHIFSSEQAVISHLDGLSVSTKEYWFNLRKSNTEKILRLNAEAISSTHLQKIVIRLKNLLHTAT
ncbi:phosphomannomutase/phosphoglucomutase [Candidatus Woesearchaeota archaeon]|nr:phosphomannomutase/phosphoglucomutase [Candidatus Woesearchaeota archaeon]